ncbi:ferredoxin (plasmid) [Azospirillum thermophilum]|uniref:Periplasmic nitrate reductase, electron transfer subunit n=1 Tax=Azospirillum thermophilum TaxID=2202148 RepID=A0A2S2CZ74_9PROT|nr:ferredoxin [Azospirillum thermophilum]
MKIAAAAALLALFAAGSALTGEIKTLRGDQPVQDNSEASDVPVYREGGVHERNYRQQPPLIPHRIEKYEVDLKVNQCLRCHDWSNAKKMGAPQVSETHFIDRSGKRLDQVAGTRWFCTQCHVPQTDAKPLVDNLFTPATQAR